MDKIANIIRTELDRVMRGQGYNLVEVAPDGERYYCHRHTHKLVCVNSLNPRVVE